MLLEDRHAADGFNPAMNPVAEYTGISTRPGLPDTLRSFRKRWLRLKSIAPWTAPAERSGDGAFDRESDGEVFQNKRAAPNRLETLREFHELARMGEGG